MKFLISLIAIYFVFLGMACKKNDSNAVQQQTVRIFDYTSKFPVVNYTFTIGGQKFTTNNSGYLQLPMSVSEFDISDSYYWNPKELGNATIGDGGGIFLFPIAYLKISFVDLGTTDFSPYSDLDSVFHVSMLQTFPTETKVTNNLNNELFRGLGDFDASRMCEMKEGKFAAGVPVNVAASHIAVISQDYYNTNNFEVGVLKPSDTISIILYTNIVK